MSFFSCRSVCKLKIELFIAQHKLLSVFLTCIKYISLLVIGLAAIKNMPLSLSQYFDRDKSLIATIVGGILTISGTILIRNREQSAKRNRKKKQVIYAPLYDELYHIQNNIYTENKFPLQITLHLAPQTSRQYPQYATWGKIKQSYVYHEVPKVLREGMDKIYVLVEKYEKLTKTLPEQFEEIYNKILETEIGTKCVLKHFGRHMFSKVLAHEQITVVENGSNPNSLESNLVCITEEQAQEIDRKFYAECARTLKLDEVKETLKQLSDTGNYMLEVLEILNKIVYFKYEA